MHLLSASPNLGDKLSLQRGARVFVNYCQGCHSLNFMRYQRLADDLELDSELVAEHLLTAGDKVGEPMITAMTMEDATRWFGVPPPDLSVIARSRGSDWLYSYLLTFYEDPAPARPFGVNNVVFEGVGMPHVLWGEQGIQRYVPAELPAGTQATHVEGLEIHGDEIVVKKVVELEDGATEHVFDRLELSSTGSMAPGQFRRSMNDLVAFLVYAGEPAKLVRYQLGFWVVLFLLGFTALARALYKEYWKDVH